MSPKEPGNHKCGMVWGGWDLKECPVPPAMEGTAPIVPRCSKPCPGWLETLPESGKRSFYHTTGAFGSHIPHPTLPELCQEPQQPESPAQPISGHSDPGDSDLPPPANTNSSQPAAQCPQGPPRALLQLLCQQSPKSWSTHSLWEPRGGFWPSWVKRAWKAKKARGRTHRVGLEVRLKVWIWGGLQVWIWGAGG